MSAYLFLVCKTGKEYNYDVLSWFTKQISENKNYIALLDDVLSHNNWQGWWTKLNLFNPNVTNNFDVMYVDLDSVVLNTNIFSMIENKSRETNKSLLLEDFYFPNRRNSGVMFIRNCDKHLVWNSVKNKTQKDLESEYSELGDGECISQLLGNYAITIQSILPNKLCSYKKHILKENQDPRKYDLICFHGQPRPWNVIEDWIPKYESV